MTAQPEQPRPGVELRWDVMWCARHLGPYRARWPEGAAVAMVRLFDAAVRLPAVSDACGGDAARLGAALARFAPVCCLVGRAALEAIYAETLPDRRGGG